MRGRKTWTGSVAEGRGEARGHLADGLDVLRKALGGPIVPGTLNVESRYAFFLYSGTLNHRQPIWFMRSLSQLERSPSATFYRPTYSIDPRIPGLDPT